MLKEGLIFEDAFQYQRRIFQAKQRIAEYKKRYHRIAIVCHYYTVEYMGADTYEKSGIPVSTTDIKNCRPYYSRIEKLLPDQDIF